MRGEERRESEGPRVFFSPFARRPPSGLMSLCFFLFFLFFLALLLFSLSLPPLPQRRRKTTRLRARGEGRHCPSLHASAVAWRDEGRGPRLESRGEGKKNDAASASALFSGRVSCLGLFVELFAGAVSSFSGFRASLAAPP